MDNLGNEELRVFPSIDEFLVEYVCGVSEEDIELHRYALKHSIEYTLGLFRLPDNLNQCLFYIVGSDAYQAQETLRRVIYHRKEHRKFYIVGEPAPDLT
jgi:hypothetical protein